jgi:hypothetical protein
VRGAHGALSERNGLHADVGDAFPPFAAGWVVPDRTSSTEGLPAITCGRSLPLDGAFHRAEVAWASRFRGGDEAGGGQMLLRRRLQSSPSTSGRLVLAWVSSAAHLSCKGMGREELMAAD